MNLSHKFRIKHIFKKPLSISSYYLIFNVFVVFSFFSLVCFGEDDLPIKFDYDKNNMELKYTANGIKTAFIGYKNISYIVPDNANGLKTYKSISDLSNDLIKENTNNSEINELKGIIIDSIADKFYQNTGSKNPVVADFKLLPIINTQNGKTCTRTLMSFTQINVKFKNGDIAPVGMQMIFSECIKNK